MSENSQSQPILVATQADAGLRLDSFVAAKLGVGRRAATRLIVGARVNGRLVAKGRVLAPGDEVYLSVSAAAETQTFDSPEVLQRNLEVLVLNKPAGLPSVALAGNPRPSTAQWLAQEFPECREIGRPGECGLVHRLDNQTSGLLLAALSAEAYRDLRGQFREHSIEKAYWALVSGEIDRPFTVDAPIGQHQKSRTRVRCLTGASHPRYKVSPATTRVTPLASAAGVSLIEARTQTGARHQIRAHLAHAGHPLVADTQYGGVPEPGVGEHLLHASALRWRALAQSELRKASCPLPDFWRKAIVERTGEDLLGRLPPG